TSVTLQSVVLDTAANIIAGPTVVATPNVSIADPPTDREALAFDGSHFLLVYVADGPPPVVPGLSGLFITPGTGQPAGSPFSASAGESGKTPAIAFDGTNYLVVYVKDDTSPVGLRAMRVSPAGSLVDPVPFPLVDLSREVLVDPMDLEPTVSFDGTNY